MVVIALKVHYRARWPSTHTHTQREREREGEARYFMQHSLLALNKEIYMGIYLEVRQNSNNKAKNCSNCYQWTIIVINYGSWEQPQTIAADKKCNNGDTISGKSCKRKKSRLDLAQFDIIAHFNRAGAQTIDLVSEHIARWCGQTFHLFSREQPPKDNLEGQIDQKSGPSDWRCGRYR